MHIPLITEHYEKNRMKFVKRMPAEFQAVCVRESLRRHPELKTHSAIREWIVSSGAAWF